MKEQSQQPKPDENKISPELNRILDDEEQEARIQTAIDAALEEGYLMTREEAEKLLLPKNYSPDRGTEIDND